ncbi:putative house-cleaning noncanonical NTP pyrophosphatase (MazG superfamily) [Pelomonas saccharophila]|uniref:House-cleaning noncanonical NTP pyrophosphatase (MazG superfamily) n=1 Tax=Roseateles saccharophilus TaxID=304 RepID=A0ABU1YYD1_ROSSA|nr:hypothetical protein [Roseateles saccharophilus]MDR7273026.1 putative house-cleaning noncanonical NTP pyrophosphatase (MazG superfamily) [Roseateles saccharophilus]
MPKTNLREVLEAIAATPEGLTDEQDAAALLDMHLGRIQACQHTDPLAQLIKVRNEAEKALKTTAKLAGTSKLVQSHRLPLADALEPLKRLIPKLQEEQAKEVEAARRKSENERGQIKQAMTRLTQQHPVDLKKLRELAAFEFARASKLDAVLKQASADELPITPSPAKVSFADNKSAKEWTRAVCEAAFQKHTWFEFKDLRKSGQEVDLPGLVEQKTVTDEVMWKLYQFRRHVVDGLIAQLHAEFPKSGLMFKSSGSEDIESDLDITVASSPPGDDVKAMSRFNGEIKRIFGRPPGRVFDTNLYARDYRAIEDNMTQGREGAPPQDRDIDEPTGPMANMSGIDQDVATLMKQRRFLDEASFTAMWQELRDSMKTQEDRQRIQQRFEEAEAVYLLTAQEKVEAIEKKIEARRAALLKKRQPTAEEAETFKAFDAARKQFEKARADHDLHQVQALLPEFLDLMEEKFPDEVMDVTDDQYAERMAKLREDQALVESSEATHQQEGPDCAQVHPGKTHAVWAAEINALKARIKQAQFTNIVFANEAYVSQGAITHIVAGAQASTPEKKQAVLGKIKPAELLQSTNEQLADFFKDMKHMEHAEKAAAPGTERRRATGEAFVHASKYLSRMLDGAAMLQEKYQGNAEATELLSGKPFALCTRAKLATPRLLQARIDEQLVKLRKSSSIPGDAKAELAVEDVKTLFNVGSVAELRALITQFSIEFNHRVRHLAEFQAAQHVELDTERQYFRPAS